MPDASTGRGTWQLRGGIRNGRSRLRADLDPLELRLRNYAESDEDRRKPVLQQIATTLLCGGRRTLRLEQAPTERPQYEGRTAFLGGAWPFAVFTVKLSRASARVQLHADGKATVETASHDIGTGTYTSLAAVAA
jgi:xanthine dehydrogenase YagR molybdenum-binding subunit